MREARRKELLTEAEAAHLGHEVHLPQLAGLAVAAHERRVAAAPDHHLGAGARVGARHHEVCRPRGLIRAEHIVDLGVVDGEAWALRAELGHDDADEASDGHAIAGLHWADRVDRETTRTLEGTRVRLHAAENDRALVVGEDGERALHARVGLAMHEHDLGATGSGEREDPRARVVLARAGAHPAARHEVGDDPAGRRLVEAEQGRQVGLRDCHARIELDERVAVRMRQAGGGILALEEAELANELAGCMTEREDLGEHSSTIVLFVV